MLNEENRAIAVSPGTDLATVAGVALRVSRQRMAVDGALFAVVCGLGVTIALWGTGLAGIPVSVVVASALLLVGWATLTAGHWVRLFGRLARALRPGGAGPRAERSPGAAARLRRVADRQATNVTLSRGHPPFPGFGAAVAGWSAAIDTTRAASALPPLAFSASEVHEYVAAALGELDLPGLHLRTQVFVTAAKNGDDRFRPDPRDPANVRASSGTVRQLIDTPQEAARPYLAATVIGWQGDLTVTTLVRFVRSPDQLFVETARAVLPPLGPAAAALDGLGRRPGLTGFAALAGRGLTELPGRLVTSGPALAYRAAAPLRRARNRRRADKAHDHTARLCVREAAAAPAARYFRDLDGQRSALIVEQQVLRSLATFLAGRNVAAPGLEPPGSGGTVRSWAAGRQGRQTQVRS